MKKYGCGIVLFFVTFSAACVAQSQGVSLGDLARKTRAGDKKPAVVFNDDNMQRSAVTDDSSSDPDTANSDQDAKADDREKQSSDKKPDSKSSSTASGADEKTRLQKQLDSLKKKQSVWSDSAKKYEEQLSNETNDFRRQVMEEALKNDTYNVRVYQQKIDQVQSELNKVQEPSNQSAPAPDHNSGTAAAPSGSQP